MDDDDHALDDFYTFEYPRLVAALRLITGDRDTGRDAVDEAIARACERRQRGHAIDNLAAWVRTVACNEARSRFRRRAAEQRATDRLVARTRELEHDADAARRVDVLRALAMLPQRQREVAALHYLCDLSVDDVAGALGVSSGTVKTSLSRARDALATLLTKEVML
jgi:RNA polymerase sigma factor (sigma-70 family)